MTNQKVRAPKSAARQYAESIGLALILAIVMRSSFMQAYVIPSGSMEPRSWPATIFREQGRLRSAASPRRSPASASPDYHPVSTCFTWRRFIAAT